ncbi:MAG TPA: hypothetical protein DCY95_12550 [Algoriphagus sp.]|nr:hypothetical protein [Algoriphagus sp.]HCX77505.1 hypothetical protein [Algoriphagus sp.]
MFLGICNSEALSKDFQSDLNRALSCLAGMKLLFQKEFSGQRWVEVRYKDPGVKTPGYFIFRS